MSDDRSYVNYTRLHRQTIPLYPAPNLEICVGHNIGYFGKPEPALRAEDVVLPLWLGCLAGCQIIGIESGGDVKGCLSLPSSVHGEHRFVEGNVRENHLREIWNRPGAFSYNRQFREEQLSGFCRVCRFRDVCRGGCAWGSYSHAGAGNDNCLCYQAVKHRRVDLLAEEPTAEERAFTAGEAQPPRPSRGVDV
jgi:radical SAM protein with 4Fe4S-binding SPASM domain